MELKLIWAQTFNDVIGEIKHNESDENNFVMPWPKNKEDLKQFKQKTENQCVLMGYNTYLSLNKKPLINRHNMVLTTKHLDEFNVLFDTEGNPMYFDGVASINQAIQIAEFLGYNTIWIIGGKSVYEECFKHHINKITEIYRTIIYCNAYGDNLIYMRDIPKTHFRLMNIEKFDTCQVEFWKIQ